MGWVQVKNFNSAKMGHEKGWCLKNVRLGYGISAKAGFPTAKADMQWNKNNGTLHTDRNSIPKGVNVPLYWDTSSSAEHITVSCGDGANMWSDGKKMAIWKKVGFFGWGEFCVAERVVRKDDTPSGFLPAKGYWGFGDNDPRIGQLSQFMRKTFPAYTSPKALGNYYGPNIMASIKEFQRRTGLEADGNTGPKTYAKLKQYGFKG